MKSILTLTTLASAVSAFPFVANQPGVDSSLIRGIGGATKRQTPANGPGSLAQCPYNPNHVPAAPVSAKYPYNNAKDGQSGNQKGGFLVPDPGDKAHEFRAPNPKTDIRGPCPGLNTAANHGFLARDGIVTFNELVDAQQNLYNVGYDLAVTLAVLGLTTTDGDPVTEKLSIGCDATPRTSWNQLLTGQEPGLDGHNKFEADTSLTRNDYFTSHGDNFKYNGTLFKMMTVSTKQLYNFDNLADYRYERYQQSLADNENFYFGPLSLLLYGAASFLYELMPNGNHDYAPDYETISSFFGANKQSDGTYEFGAERIPPNWTNRVQPYTNEDVTNQILQMYEHNPVLFGGATGPDGNFDTINFGNGMITNGKLTPHLSATDTSCLLYMLATERIPSSLNSVLTPSVQALNLISAKLDPQFENLGCPKPLTR